MPTRYPVEIPGCENKKVELQVAGFLSPIKLFVDDEPARPGKMRNELVVRGKGGKNISVYVQNAFFDTVPKLRVDGKTIVVTPPLKWYQYVWCGLPLIFILIGGLMGAIAGLFTFILNISIMRSKFKPVFRYILIGLINIVLYFALAIFAEFIRAILGG